MYLFLPPWVILLPLFRSQCKVVRSYIWSKIIEDSSPQMRLELAALGSSSVIRTTKKAAGVNFRVFHENIQRLLWFDLTFTTVHTFSSRALKSRKFRGRFFVIVSNTSFLSFKSWNEAKEKSFAVRTPILYSLPFPVSLRALCLLFYLKTNIEIPHLSIVWSLSTINFHSVVCVFTDVFHILWSMFHSEVSRVSIKRCFSYTFFLSKCVVYEYWFGLLD